MTQLKKILGKQMIYDGTDEKYYDEHKIRKPGTKEIITSFNIIDAQRLIEFEQQSLVNKSYTQQILSLCDNIFSKKRPDIYGSDLIYLWKSVTTNDLFSVYCFENKEYICIFASGEKQYGRYQIWLEGLFLKL